MCCVRVFQCAPGRALGETICTVSEEILVRPATVLPPAETSARMRMTWTWGWFSVTFPMRTPMRAAGTASSDSLTCRAVRRFPGWCCPATMTGCTGMATIRNEQTGTQQTASYLNLGLPFHGSIILWFQFPQVEILRNSNRKSLEILGTTYIHTISYYSYNYI